MLVVSVVLLTLWLGALVLDLGMGGSVHLLALTAGFLLLTGKTPRRRLGTRRRA